MLDAAAVEADWSGTLRNVRAGMLAVPSRASARLPHLTPHDIAEIDAEVRAVLTEISEDQSVLADGMFDRANKTNLRRR
jgi:phage terminase Nu1 subunit (DNA packaging protein)